MQRISILFILCALLGLALSASPPSFCKCTCFSNSTIIQLGPGNEPTSGEVSLTHLLNLLEARAGNGGSSCSKCNKAFCLAQGIPFCKTAEDKDVFTTCFQRDSRKDQIIVLLFITATVGLLAWAGARRLLERLRDGGNRAGSLGNYAPMGARDVLH